MPKFMTIASQERRYQHPHRPIIFVALLLIHLTFMTWGVFSMQGALLVTSSVSFIISTILNNPSQALFGLRATIYSLLLWQPHFTKQVQYSTYLYIQLPDMSYAAVVKYHWNWNRNQTLMQRAFSNLFFLNVFLTKVKIFQMEILNSFSKWFWYKN